MRVRRWPQKSPATLPRRGSTTARSSRSPMMPTRTALKLPTRKRFYEGVEALATKGRATRHESIFSANYDGCARDSGRGCAAAAGHRILRLSRRVGVDRNGHGNGSRLDNGILRAFDDEARWHLHPGWPGGENRYTAFSDIGLIVPFECDTFECDTIGCRRRVHLQRTIIRLIYRYDALPRSAGGST